MHTNLLMLNMDTPNDFKDFCEENPSFLDFEKKNCYGRINQLTEGPRKLTERPTDGLMDGQMDRWTYL